MEQELTLEEATAFFSEYYGGEHHFPGQIKKFGSRGWAMNDDRGGMATYDYKQLTTLVFMAHEYCYRVELLPSSPRHIKIAVWKRQREGGMSSRHPDILTALEDFNKSRTQNP